MNSVMQNNNIRIKYVLSDEYVNQHWIETGEYVSPYQYATLLIETPEQRQIIVNMQLNHEFDMLLKNISPVYILSMGKANWITNIKEFQFSKFSIEVFTKFDHVLTHQEIWQQLEKDSQK